MVTDAMMKVLEGFYHRITRRIEVMTEKKDYGGEWGWASVDAALENMGVWTIRGYVRGWQAIIAENVAGRLIDKLCTGADQI